MVTDALSVLCAQLTRDLLAIAKFLFYCTQQQPLCWHLVVHLTTGDVADKLIITLTTTKLQQRPFVLSAPNRYQLYSWSAHAATQVTANANSRQRRICLETVENNVECG